MSKIELLAPAGSKESFYSAINAGCNAVYLGGMKFGARSYANNFTIEELSEMIGYAHSKDVKVYCTVNTVIFEDELNEVIDFIGEIHKIGIDAILIQDYGLLNIIHKIYPNLVLHASTQMNASTFEEVKELKELGVERVVLARETHIDEIKKIKEKLDIEIEVFVHGAICISYSGNCYMSSIITKRSGNRGRCAGSCRLEYKLINDKGFNEPFNYPISSKDLMTIEQLDSLISAGVDSLKIEGRMKRPEYVAQVVSSYKKAIDSYYSHKTIDFKNEIKEMKYAFNRGFTKGFLFGEKNSLIVNSNQPNHIGVLVGEVINTYSNGTIDIRLSEEIIHSDSIRIVGKVTDAITINQVKVGNVLRKHGQKNEIVNVKTHIDNKQIRQLQNAKVYKTTSALQLERANSLTIPQTLITGIVYLENEMFYLSLTDGVNTVSDSIQIDEYAKSTYNDRIISQIKKCGPEYKLESLTNNLDKEVFIQISKINNLRRNLLEKLTTLRRQNKVKYIRNEYDFEPLSFTRDEVGLAVRCRTERQLTVALNCGIKKIYISDYNIYKKYSSSFEGVNVYYYPPRVGNNCKANNKAVSRIDDYCQGNISTIYANCCNSYTLRSLASKVDQVGLSLELDKTRMKLMLEEYKKKYINLPNLEMLVYGRYELMVMKYCVINDKIIKNDDIRKNKLHCQECIKNQYSLVDKGGYTFPLIKEENCNLRVLNSKVTNLINHLDDIILMGINSLLLDFILEEPEEVKKVIEMFKEKLSDINKTYSKNDLAIYTSGHFNEGVL